MVPAVKVVLENCTPIDNDTWLKRGNERLTVMLSQGRNPFSSQLKLAKITSFNNREHAIALLQATCHLPLVGGIRPKWICGEPYYDGWLITDTTTPTGIKRPDDIQDCDVLIGVDLDTVVGTADRERCISPYFDFPLTWRLFPPTRDALWMIHRFGYLRALEFLLSDPSIALIRQLGVEVTVPQEASLRTTREEIESLVAKLTELGGKSTYP